MKTALLLTVVSIALSVGASLAAVRWWSDTPSTGTASVATNGHRDAKSPPVPALPEVVALGTLQPEGGVIQVSGPAGERLAELKVAEGDDVRKGDVLAVLESFDLRQLEYAAAKGTLAEAENQLPIEKSLGDAQVEEATVNAEQVELRQAEIATQEDKVKALKANLEVAQHDSKRLAALDESIVSTQQREKQKLAVDQAETELAAAEHALSTMRDNYSFEKKLAQAKLHAAEATRDRMIAALQIESLKRTVKLAETKLQMSQVRAPVNGRIFKVVMQPGETTGQVPILRMGDVSKMYAVAEVYETDIGRIELHQHARVTGDALIDSTSHDRYALTGEVTRIGSMVSSNEVRSLDPTDRGDLRVVDVRVLIDDKFREAASRLINLQVTVRIETPATPPPSHDIAPPPAATQAQR